MSQVMKYQLCAIRTADNITDGKSRKSIVSEKSPSFRPAQDSRSVLAVAVHGPGAGPLALSLN